ncbi:MAG: hypothetical protein Q8L35_07535 [Actinomycetota bacterium]|nr:hypothetical protein [Actinomycetota bacterium]
MSDKVTVIIQRFFEEMQVDVVEERVVNYILKELHLGRKLSVIIQDPYVKNRVDEDRLGQMLENKEIISAVEEELEAAFKGHDFKFAE